MRNTLVIYKTADSRVVSFAEQTYGMPIIGNFDSTALWEPGTMDYQVGVNVYDPEDFDPATDLLTDVACAKWGIELAEKDHYIKDLEITLPLFESGADRIDDFVVSLDSNSHIESIDGDALSLALRPTFLKVYIQEYIPGGINVITTDPLEPGVVLVDDFDTATNYIKVHVEKHLADGTLDDEATDEVVIRVDSGVIRGAGIANLAAGVADFYWSPAMDNSLQTVTAKPGSGIQAPGQEILPGSAFLRVDTYPAPPA